MFRAPAWAAQHPRLIGVAGLALVAVGLGVVAVLLGRRTPPAARARGLVLQLCLVADGLAIGFLLRLLTVGAEGASFTGLALLGVPPMLVLTVVLVIAERRFARSMGELR